MKRLLSLLVLLGLLLPLTFPANAAIKAGTTCTKLNSTKTYAGYKYKCVKSGKKLVWGKGVKVVVNKPTPSPSKPTATPTPTPSATPTSLPPQSETPSPTPSVTVTSTPTPTITPTKYGNCTLAKAAGVAPIRKDTNPALYEVNAGLDRDKDGVACDN